MELCLSNIKLYIALAIASMLSTVLVTFTYGYIDSGVFIRSPTVQHFGVVQTRTCQDTRCAIAPCDIQITGYDSKSTNNHFSIKINNTLAFDVYNLPGLYLTTLATNCSFYEVRRFTTHNETRLVNYMARLQRGTTVAGISGGGYLPGTDAQRAMRHVGLLGDNKTQFNNKGVLSFVGRIGFPGFTIRKWTETNIVMNETYKYFVGADIQPIMKPKSWTELSTKHPIEVGGEYYPHHCKPRYKIAIIIPFRDREEHLKIFINHMIRFLKTQLLAFTIFVIEQEPPEIFNRAMLMNVGFVEASKHAKYDCFVFHDVDLLPLDLCNSYYCSDIPRHLVVSYNKNGYKKLYNGHFGGANIFNTVHMKMTNGFSNRFFGWGGEDDEAYLRFKSVNNSILRQPTIIGRYDMIVHKGDNGNPRSGISMERSYKNAKYHKVDGISTLAYNRTNVTQEALYTRIRVRIPGPSSTGDLKQYKNIIGQAVKPNNSSKEVGIS